MKKLDDKKVNEIIDCYKNNLTDKEISEKIGCSISSVLRIRQKNNLQSNYKKIKRRNCKDLPLTTKQKQILCGTLLGDSSLQYMSKKSITPIFTSCHCFEQENYAKLLAKELNGKCVKRKRYDKRTNKTYTSFYVTTKTNLEFVSMYNNLYKDNKKIITQKFLENFTDISLAHLYMDDGYMSHKTAFICTDCFNEESCDILIKFLKEKFDLTFRKNIHEKKIRLRLSFNDRIKFRNIIEPHLLPDFFYKLPPKEKSNALRNNYKKTTEEFIKELESFYGDKYDYSKVRYVNNTTPVCLIEKNTKKEIYRKPMYIIKKSKKELFQ